MWLEEDSGFTPFFWRGTGSSTFPRSLHGSQSIIQGPKDLCFLPKRNLRFKLCSSNELHLTGTQISRQASTYAMMRFVSVAIIVATSSNVEAFRSVPTFSRPASSLSVATDPDKLLFGTSCVTSIVSSAAIIPLTIRWSFSHFFAHSRRNDRNYAQTGAGLLWPDSANFRRLGDKRLLHSRSSSYLYSGVPQ